MNAPEAERWLAYARSDLSAGRTLLRDPEHYPRQVCFLAQQAAEKALKALLVLFDIEFPHTHDLDRLRESVPSGWHVKADFPHLYALSIMMGAEYPGLISAKLAKSFLPSGDTADTLRKLLLCPVAKACYNMPTLAERCSHEYIPDGLCRTNRAGSQANP
jgi:hypothetical protein